MKKVKKIDYYGAKMHWTGNFKEDVKRYAKALEFPLGFEYFNYEYVERVKNAYLNKVLKH